jgi:DNA-binding NarL/FixJ family response regulator
MKIYLVDDNDNFRKTLKFFLENHLNYKITGEAVNGKDFLENTIIDADIILMDINMPGINGLEATKFGMWKNKNYKIIAVSQYKDNVDLQQLIGAGFKGFVSKVDIFRDLESAIKTVVAGKLFFPDDIKLF